MPKFKKGDRVRCFITGNIIKAGMIGTVLEDDSIPYVDWVNFANGTARPEISGHDFPSVLAIDQSRLELIKPEIDLTAIDKPFGLLDAETQKALNECGGPYEFFSREGKWEDWYGGPITPGDGITFRKKPGPIRVKRSFNGCILADGTIAKLERLHNVTVTYETVDGEIDLSTYKVTKREYEHD